MTPTRLRTLLSAAQGEAVPTFLSLLDEPGVDVHPDSDKHSVSTANLLTIYRRLAEHVRRVGLLTLGFDETVTRLEATSHERLTLGLATGPEGHPSCIAFLAEDLSVIVAALAVLGPLTEE